MSKYAIIRDEKGKNYVSMILFIMDIVAICPILFAILAGAPKWVTAILFVICMLYIVSMEVSKKAIFGELKDDTYHNKIVGFLYWKCIEGFEKKCFDMTYYKELIKKG